MKVRDGNVWLSSWSFWIVHECNFHMHACKNWISVFVVIRPDLVTNIGPKCGYEDIFQVMMLEKFNPASKYSNKACTNF